MHEVCLHRFLLLAPIRCGSFAATIYGLLTVFVLLRKHHSITAWRRRENGIFFHSCLLGPSTQPAVIRRREISISWGELETCLRLRCELFLKKREMNIRHSHRLLSLRHARAKATAAAAKLEKSSCREWWRGGDRGCGQLLPVRGYPHVWYSNLERGPLEP